VSKNFGSDGLRSLDVATTESMEVSSLGVRGSEEGWYELPDDAESCGEERKSLHCASTRGSLRVGC